MRSAAGKDPQLAGEDRSLRGPILCVVRRDTGDAELREGDYYGTVVNRCARIRSSAEPGQVLVSAAVARAGSPPAGWVLSDLGWRELADFADPERVWELLGQGSRQGVVARYK